MVLLWYREKLITVQQPINNNKQMNLTYTKCERVIWDLSIEMNFVPLTN